MKSQNRGLTNDEINKLLGLYSSGKIDEAIYEIKKLNKDFPNVPFLFNLLGVCYKSIGRTKDSVKAFEAAVLIKPDYAEAFNNLGIVLLQLKQSRASVVAFEKAINSKLDFAEAHNNLGAAYKDLNRLEDAVKSYNRAIKLKPEYYQAYNNLGNILKTLGSFEKAINCYKSALSFNSRYAEAFINLGVVYKELNQLEESVESYQRAIKINPQFAEAHNNLGVVLKELHQFESAKESLVKALSIDPKYVEAYNNFGAVYKELNQPERAEKQYQRALVLNPKYAEAHFNYGVLMSTQKKLQEALLSYERAFAIKPDIDFLFGNLFQIKMRLCLWDSFSSDLDTIKNKIDAGEVSLPLFSLQAVIDEPHAQLKAAQIHAKKFYPKSPTLPVMKKYFKHNKIRLGYFSADFRAHPVAELVAELFETHDRSRFEVYAFSFGLDTNDDLNLRIREGVDYFYDVNKLSDKAVAILARKHEIDIAIDLGGYTENARTKIFAMRAAPTQVSYLGYTGTMGSKYIDYLIADKVVIPDVAEKYYDENIVYLPNSYMVNDSKTKISNNVLKREDHGLPIEGFVFCCFNNHFKITSPVFRSWMRILKAVDGSVLWLAETDSDTIFNLKKNAKSNSVDPNRLIFAPRLKLKRII